MSLIKTLSSLSLGLFFVVSSAVAQDMSRTSYTALRLDVMEKLRQSQMKIEKMASSASLDCRNIAENWESVVFSSTEGLGQLTPLEEAGYMFPDIYRAVGKSLSGAWFPLASRFGC